MALPTLCLSSKLTTYVAEFRNPQVREENWLCQPEHIENYWIHSGKVITAEASFALLCVTSTVETVAFGILTTLSLPLYLYNSDYLDTSYKYLCSSSFTLFWNVGNVLVFNPFCINITTHESFARFSMDHMTRGSVYKTIITVFEIAMLVFTKGTYRSNRLLSQQIFDTPFLRIEDRLFMVHWLEGIRSNNIPSVINDLLLRNIAIQANRDIAAIGSGELFLRHYILESKGNFAVSGDTIKNIKDGDPNVYHFIASRAVFIYVFGEKKTDPIPNFFANQTIINIQRLRIKYSKQPELSKAIHSKLYLEMISFPYFNKSTSTELNEIKIAAARELQGAMLTSKCLQNALKAPCAS